MKLVIYDEAYNIVDKVENIQNPVVDGNTVIWEGGSMGGINLPFVLLENTVEVNEMSAEKEALDKKEQYKKKDLAKENNDLKKQLTDLSFELMMKGVL